MVIFFFSIKPSPVHLISCMAVMSVLYESHCYKSFFRTPAWYNDNTFHVSILKIFNPLRCRPRQNSPVFTSSDFLTIIFSRDGVVSPMPNTTAILEEGCFSVGIVSLSRPDLINASGTHFEPLHVLDVEDVAQEP